MAKDAELGIWFETDIKSSVAGQLNPLFKNFTQSEKMNINCFDKMMLERVARWPLPAFLD